MPGFLYGDNQAKEPRGNYPRLAKGESEAPRSPYWMVRADRLSHPVAMVYVGSYGWGISATPYLVRTEGLLTSPHPGSQWPVSNFIGFNGFGCSIQEGAAISYTLGWENAPGLYNSNWKPYEPNGVIDNNGIYLAPGEEMGLHLKLFAALGEDPRCLSHIIRDVYQQWHEEPRRETSVKDGVKLISEAIERDSYLSEYKNYSTQVFWKKDPVKTDPKRLAKETEEDYFQAIPSIAWTGGLACAVPMMVAGIRLKDETMRLHAIESIQNVVDNSYNPKSKLPYDAFNVFTNEWSTEGWWRKLLDKPGHSSYLIGQFVYYLLRAYQYEEALADTLHEDWLAYAVKICNQMLSTCSPEGEYPYVWNEEDGEALDWDGMSGCWCAASIALLGQIRKDDALLDEAAKSERFYHNKFVKAMKCYGTPHDTYKAMDNEGILSYIHLARILHEETVNDLYLSALVDGLEYEFTWKFCWNVPVQVAPLSKNGWCASGGSITSTCNPHVHPMSNMVLDDLLYAWQKTGDRYLLSRLKDTLLWGLQTFNRREREFDFGRLGWMSERFCYSQGLLEEKYPDGSPASTWFCYLPWGAANVVEGMIGDLWEFGEEILKVEE